MARWALVAVASLVALALAGCSGGGSGDAPAASSSTSTSSGPAVMATIAASAGDRTASNGTLEAQANETLTFDASGSTGAIAAYAWDFGDGGNATARVAKHAYNASGTFTVRLTVSGLLNASSTATLTVNVTVPPTGVFYTEGFTFEGDLPVMNPNSCTTQGVDCQDHVVTIVAADPNGTAAVARRIGIVVDGDCPAGPACSMQVFWRSPDGTALNQTAASGVDHVLGYSGAMEPGDYVIRVRLFTGAGASYTVLAAVEYSYP